MQALMIDARYAFRDRVEDRDPDTGYSHSDWLVPRPVRRPDDWLDFAFSFGDPGATGRFRPRRSG